MREITQGALRLAIQITGSREEARDILQTAILKSLERGSAPKPGDEGFRPWLFRVVHNQAIDWLRSRRKFSTAEVPELAGTDTEPGHVLELERRKRLLHQALNRLSAAQREIICLKDFHDFSYDDIAQIMAIEKGTVMSRLHRARMALKDELLALDLFPGDAT